MIEEKSWQLGQTMSIIPLSISQDAIAWQATLEAFLALMINIQALPINNSEPFSASMN